MSGWVVLKVCVQPFRRDALRVPMEINAALDVLVQSLKTAVLLPRTTKLICASLRSSMRPFIEEIKKKIGSFGRAHKYQVRV